MAASAAVSSQARGQDASPSFERDVAPILSANCWKCHGADKRAGLDLRTLPSMLKGGDDGPVLVKGAAGKSLLFKQIASRTMPPGRMKLTPAQVNTIRAWINAGAPAAHSARVEGAPSGDQARQHWAFRPLARPAIPAVRSSLPIRTPIDSFVLAKLESKGLGFSPEADRHVLLRRASYALVGLPPSLEETDLFLADERDDACERLLDRLLASSHFGERWGRYWLDAAGYVDTLGYDVNIHQFIRTDNKWLYRDYVIRSFNEDKPFGRFVTEQLAGDEQVEWRSATRFTPEIRTQLIATGLLRNAEDRTDEIAPLLKRYEVLFDTVQILGSNFLGLSLQCARCHDHKFEPVSQEDYYRLMACFAPAFNPRNWKQPQDRPVPDVSALEKAAIERHNAHLDRQAGQLHRRIEDLRRPHESQLRERKLATLPEPIRADTRAALATPAAKRTVVQTYLAAKLGPLLTIKPEEIDLLLNAEEKKAVARIQEQLTALKAGRRSFGVIQAIYDVGPPPPSHLLKRGDFQNPGKEVAPGFLRVLSNAQTDSWMRQVEPGRPSSGRRSALARWLTDPQSPASALFARVLVNRIWQHLMGRGLVATPDNFGLTGDAPTHPELLDWLADEFVRNGWRVKALIKLIMTSSVYRQSSQETANQAEARDPANHLLWRMRLRRLESECLRDALLIVSGKLDRTLGGPPIRTVVLGDGTTVLSENDLPTPTARWRRSLYLLNRRQQNLSFLSIFDQPSLATNCTCRQTSAVPLQSLAMMNNALVLEQADHFAERVAHLAGPSREKQIEVAFRLALARRPDATERTACSQFLAKQCELHEKANLPGPKATQKALATLCHTLLNTSEFLYVE
jgi:hypothetical protein